MIYALGWAIVILAWLVGMNQAIWFNYADVATIGFFSRLGRLVLVGVSGFGMLIGLFILGYGVGIL